ncbi:type II toxin-antitoxin system RatA family toxin [Lutibaculum baratangense]|uniref:Putative oligoketide cyclase/dehydratase or lipid transport protein YfjG n=1 Tax=Lutibaculum baratangense AMV1 TaxID=631454 RepID=V4RVZ7_9HYPH|nr:type II toxin-antitoxin system RatA family toxin [Lutibaculum baratangense]ESR27210.1 putative oligoketide cyclase/dehydratase or lipid transport protein YfjG [Lutibaculum baratangense AMV1]
MREFKTRRRVRHSAADMFALVADVERYPEFVPLCESLKVRDRKQEGDTETVIASMTVAYKVFRETFTSRVTLDRPNLRILVEYIDGPFKRMANRWTFHAIDESTCEVEFYLGYELRSRTLQMVVGGVFDAAFSRFAQAFERRADAVYGRGGRSAVAGAGQAGFRREGN